MNNAFYLRKSGRVCYPFPFVSGQAECTWNTTTHMRVMIPLTEKEKLNSRKLCHTQIVARSNVVSVAAPRFKLKVA